MTKFYFRCFNIKAMSMFGDYKSYKKFAPQYPEWKSARDVSEAKRQEYLRRNPSEINAQDLQKSKALLRAIDIMDEYSQKRAEDMEVATESVVGMGLELATFLGGGLGFLATKINPLKSIIAKNNKKSALIAQIASAGIGAMLASAAAFPLYAWAAKAEVKASRKGRFEAMTKELNSPKAFAVLTEEQEKELKQIVNNLPPEKKNKNPIKSLKENWHIVKNMAIDSKEYKEQRKIFELQLEQEKNLFDKELTPKEIEDAKRDQQLLTKLVEKIDIASQDYAENTELATQTFTTVLFGLGALFTLGYEKLAKKLKWKQSAVPAGLSLVAMCGASIFAAQIQKQASRVGRFKVKQDLLKHPEQLAYVSDEKTGEITDVEVKSDKKPGLFKFLKDAWKNNKEFNKWKENEGAQEKKITKALEQIDLSDEQIKDAKRLQYNTFKTFNKVDENSQKYSESIEALGQSLQYPISFILSGLGALWGLKYLTKSQNTKTTAEAANGFMKYMSAIIVSTLPSIGINAYITKEQKKASRIADMLAINEMSDYRNFADYSNRNSALSSTITSDSVS